MEYALTGEFFSAEDTHAWGLVNRLTDPGEALAGPLGEALRPDPRGRDRRKRRIPCAGAGFHPVVAIMRHRAGRRAGRVGRPGLTGKLHH